METCQNNITSPLRRWNQIKASPGFEAQVVIVLRLTFIKLKNGVVKAAFTSTGRGVKKEEGKVKRNGVKTTGSVELPDIIDTS